MLERTREFIQLANAMSFSKAAKELNMSQPSLRRHIAELESELGFSSSSAIRSRSPRPVATTSRASAL